MQAFGTITPNSTPDSKTNNSTRTLPGNPARRRLLYLRKWIVCYYARCYL